MTGLSRLPPKCPLSFKGLHGVISQNIDLSCSDMFVTVVQVNLLSNVKGLYVLRIGNEGIFDVRRAVFTPVNMMVTSNGMAPCSLVDKYHIFGGTCCFHVIPLWEPATLIQAPAIHRVADFILLSNDRVNTFPQQRS
jgi:hypothetical protein